MKDFFVQDAAQHENQTITSSFLVAAKQVKPKKSGEPYLALSLADRTGHLEAKMWDNVPQAMDAFEQDDIVKVRGLVNKYNGRFQLTIHKLRRLQEGEIDYADYLPKPGKDIDQLWRQLAAFVAGLRNPHLKALLEQFTGDPEFAGAFRACPAAKTLHHAFLGGLLEHVVSLLNLCDLASRNYPQIDRDLLLAGAFLHDIGKIHELAFARGFAYTTRGKLLGHMVLELEMVQQKIALLPGFPAELKTLLEHLIISHHGEYEFGSPKRPMFPEALMLHYLDDLDSKMESMRAHLEREADSEWSGFNGSLGRPLLNTRKFLEEAAKKGSAGAENKAEAAAGEAGEKP